MLKGGGDPTTSSLAFGQSLRFKSDQDLPCLASQPGGRPPPVSGHAPSPPPAPAPPPSPSPHSRLRLELPCEVGLPFLSLKRSRRGHLPTASEAEVMN